MYYIILHFYINVILKYNFFYFKYKSYYNINTVNTKMHMLQVENLCIKKLMFLFSYFL